MSIKGFREKDIRFDDVISILRDDKWERPQIYYPFDGSLKGNPNEIITKILFINLRDSTQIKNKDIDKLNTHIKRVLLSSDLEVLQKGELNERYFKIVDNIAFEHGIIGSSSTEHNLTSFSSKFCGSHNQKAPFWDNRLHEFLRYLGYELKYRNYRDYVAKLGELQAKHGLTEYSLREIEKAMWTIADYYNL